MKKILSCIPLLSLSISYAQWIEPKFSGFVKSDGGYSYANETFTSSNEYQNMEWLPQIKKAVRVDSLRDNDSVCQTWQDTFSYHIDRKNGYGYITLTQPYLVFPSAEPIGFLFGKDGWGRKAFLDFGGTGAKLSFSLSNTSKYDVRIGVSLVDTSGNEIDAVGTSPDDRVYEDNIFFIADNGSSISQTVLWVKDYYRAIFSLSNETGSCHWLVADGKDHSFNMKAVAGVLFRIINQENANGFDGYKSYRLDSATFVMDNILLQAATGLSSDDQLLSDKVVVGPNPTKGNLRFSQALSSTKLLDMMGNVVQTTSSAESMDVSHLTPGMYLLTAPELSQPIKILKE